MVITLEALRNIISEEISAIYSEAFDTDVDWVLGYDNGDSQIFATKIDDAYIEIEYLHLENNVVHVQFSRDSSIGITGQGNQNKIFGAVINHIKKWVDKNKPSKLVFSAFKPRSGPFGAQDNTRSNLYRKIVQRFAKQNDFDYTVQDDGTKDTFTLIKKNIKQNTVKRATTQDSDVQKSEQALREIEPYQKTVTAKHPAAKKRLLGFGSVRDSSTPYKIKISFKRGKSAPPIG